MSLNIPNSWLALPKIALSAGLGAVVSATVFNKLSHLAEYTLNKKFGDYDNLKRTLNNKVIVSTPPNKDYYYIQNIALGVVVATIFSKAIHFVVARYCPDSKATPLLVGSIGAPVLFALFNMISRHSEDHRGSWVEISDAEIKARHIVKDDLEKIDWPPHVYTGFGTSPERFPGVESP